MIATAGRLGATTTVRVPDVPVLPAGSVARTATWLLPSRSVTTSLKLPSIKVRPVALPFTTTKAVAETSSILPDTVDAPPLTMSTLGRTIQGHNRRQGIGQNKVSDEPEFMISEYSAVIFDTPGPFIRNLPYGSGNRTIGRTKLATVSLSLVQLTTDVPSLMEPSE